MSKVSTNTHICTTAQAERLAKCAGWVAWQGERGIHSLDRVECDGEAFVYGGMDEDGEEWLWDTHGHSCGNIEAADCRLLPSESDLLDYLETVGHVFADGPADGIPRYQAYVWDGEPFTGEGNTRIDALIAAVEAVEEVRG